MKKKDPENCPYCQAEIKGCSDGWGMSPEGWEQMKVKHLKEHCDICPTCEQATN